MTLILSAKQRNTKITRPNQVRRADFIPSELYGHGIENKHVSVPKSDFLKVLHQAGESQLIQLQVEDEARPRNVLIYGLEHDPKTGDILHVDFYQVRMDEKITTEVPLRFEGKAEAQEVLGGSLVKNLHQLRVRALPDKLPVEIVVDISSLKTFEDRITVKDVRSPEGTEILNAPDETVAVVVAIEVEPVAVPETAEAEIIEKIEVAGKKEPAGTQVEEQTAKKEETK